MIHYLVIGHACGEESEGLTLKFREEKTTAFIEEKFIEAQRKQWDTDPDTKIYVDWIIKSKTPMKVKARLYYD